MHTLENAGYTSHMLDMTSYDFLARLSRQLIGDTYVPVPMISGLPELDAQLQVLRAGAMNFLTKPIDLKLFLAEVHSLLEIRFLSVRLNQQRGVLEHMVQRRTEELRRAHYELLDRLARVAEYRDDATGRHTQRVGRLCYLLARQLGLPLDTASLLGRTARLHDLGKVSIPDAILLKQGPLTNTSVRS